MFTLDEQHRDEPRQEDAIERPGASDTRYRRAEFRDGVQVQEVGADQRP